MSPSPIESEANVLILGWPGTGIACLHRFVSDALPDHQAFYQPFHPRIHEILELYEQNPETLERTWGEPVDGISPRLQFTPYFDRPELIREFFDPAFGGSYFYRETGEGGDHLNTYLRQLVETSAPVVLTLARGPGRAAFLRNFFSGAGTVLLIRDPLSLWIRWHGDEKEDPFSDGLSDSVHQMDRRYQELEARLTGDQWEEWGFEWARNHSPFARFLVVWGLTHYLSMGQLSKSDRSATLRWEELRSDPEAVRDWLGNQLSLDWTPDPRIQPGHHDLRPEVPESWQDQFRRLTEDLPETSPLPGILGHFDYIEREPASDSGFPG